MTDFLELDLPTVPPTAEYFRSLDIFALRKFVYSTVTGAPAVLARRILNEREAAGEGSEPFEDLTADQVLEQWTAERRKAMAAAKERRQVENAQVFMASEPRYKATAKNGRNIDAYLHEHGLPGTVDNISRAFNELAEAGLVDVNRIPPKPRPTIDELMAAGPDAASEYLVSEQAKDEALNYQGDF